MAAEGGIVVVLEVGVDWPATAEMILSGAVTTFVAISTKEGGGLKNKTVRTNLPTSQGSRGLSLFDSPPAAQTLNVRRRPRAVVWRGRGRSAWVRRRGMTVRLGVLSQIIM